MKIEIKVEEQLGEMEVEIRCRQLTAEVERILAALRMMNNQLTGKRDGELHLINIDAVIYIESVDRHTFLYTDDAVYESDLKLYELEQRLEEAGFCRVSRSCLIQLRQIRSLRAELDRKLRVTLSSGEQIIASRQYADELKRRLGVS
ncbi:MAG TPA: LytTR family transcriptional regulator DNA-binding domain-containing protein [Candidatus Pygmaiobacter gallistercoris]|nr:LytTR family transcriptional regulator DNA-binding domain-containing protein [Candidatus Pygmaiobacter gallistercoris]